MCCLIFLLSYNLRKVYDLSFYDFYNARQEESPRGLGGSPDLSY